MNKFKLKIHKLLRDTPKLVLTLGAVMVIGGGAAIATIGIGGGIFGGGVNLQDGLIGHWKLDGDAKDSTPYNNHANKEHGITRAYISGNLTFIAQQWNGSSNNGEFDIECTGGDSNCSFTDINGLHSTPNINSGVACGDGNTGTGYIMFSEESVHTRFSDNPPHSSNADNYICARHNNEWQYDTNNSWVSFTPASTDTLVAAVDFSNDTVEALEYFPDPSVTDRNGQSGKAMNFDGVDDYLDLGTDTLDAYSNEDWSVSFWMNAEDFSSGTYRGIIGNGFSAGNVWAIEIRESSQVNLELNGDSGNRDRVGTSQVGFNQWNHIVAVYDSDAKTATIYANAVNEGSTDYTDTGDFDTGNAEIGRRPDSNSRYFGGKIDDARFYERALSSEEVSALHDSYDSSGVQVASTQKNLVSHWKMDGNGSDATPYSNYGTVNGATPTTDRHGQTGSALDFDGTDDDITGTSQPDVQTSPNLFTVSGFINPGNQDSFFITPQSNGRDQFIAYDAANERLRVNVAESANTNNRARFSALGSVPLNTWTHWTVVINGLNIKIYINGEIDQEFNESISIAGWNNEWRIGQRGNGTNWLLGKLDDIRVYRRELAPSEISNLHDSYNPEVQISDLSKGLKGHWSFNGDPKDKTPWGNNGTLVNGPVLTADRHGRTDSAYSLDGTDDWIDLSDGGANDIAISGAMSLSLWFKAQKDVDTEYLMDNRNPGSWWWILDYTGGSSCSNDNNNICFENRVWATGSDWNANEWTHVVVTDDTSTASMYVNGNLVDTGTGESSSISTNLRVGTRYNNQQYLNGEVDDVRVYDRALTETEAKMLYETYR